MSTTDNTYGWIFHKGVDGVWRAAKREHYTDLFNNISSPNILSSRSIKTLEEIINKTDGDKSLIKKLINDK